MSVQVVWFKRDLRLHDHEPLSQAAQRGPCICLYVYEPEVYEAEESDPSHLVFINDCLKDLDDSLRERGGRLTFRVGRMPNVLDSLFEQFRFESIWSHEETGNWTTYMRDERVRAWCRQKGLRWREFPQTGVIRPLRDRDGWSRLWRQRMTRRIIQPPESIEDPKGLRHSKMRGPEERGIGSCDKDEMQRGGESRAWQVFNSFLYDRGACYRSGNSSPVTAWECGSRLSPYLAYGALSVKQVFQSTEERVAEVKALRERGEDLDKRWVGALRAFEGRLRWHCHFMQKLEDEPRIEFENMARAYDGMRESEWNQERYDAWRLGRTGYPMVDACMRALHRAGWINFRMRAMLVSFSSYNLWLHWRQPSLWLAQHFVDFEPGIHYSQFQMQSGTTGINAIRMYSPTKQVRDHDPEGRFIRNYVPELSLVPNEYVAEPWTMPKNVQDKAGCIIGRDYPEPIVDEKDSMREARSRIMSIRGSKTAREEAERIYQKHGSRRRPDR